MTGTGRVEQLRDQGYCVIQGLLDSALLADIRADVAGILPSVSVEHRERNRSQGSLVHLADHPGFAPLIGSAALRAALRDLEFPDPRFSSGYLISKPPKSPALFWHQDWWGWDDPISYTDAIAQVFAMVYLTDTTPQNGCLRVIPGTHRRDHPLHAPSEAEAHAEALSKVDDPNHPLYGARPDEVAVPVTAGDVIIGDARLLHGAFANQTDAERSLITLWYHPDFGSLPAPMQARIGQIFDREGVDTDAGGAAAMTLDDWPADQRRLVKDLFPPKPDGIVPHPWNRTPNWRAASGA